MQILNTVQYYSIENNRKIQKSKIAFKNKKNNNSFKVKNDNGPICVFICYCSTPR